MDHLHGDPARQRTLAGKTLARIRQRLANGHVWLQRVPPLQQGVRLGSLQFGPRNNEA